MKYGKNISRFNPEKLSKHNVDRQSIQMIANGSRVLEIGCATGFMGEYLIKKKKCEVVGVELGLDEAKIARTKLTKVIVGDIEYKQTISQIRKMGKFDVVFAAALIEHLKDPWEALRTWKTFLKPNGVLIISTSNVAHWSQRIKSVRGTFNYTEYGILDNTHLRFFTTNSFQKLVTDSGFTVREFKIDAEGGGYPRASLLGAKFFPNIFAYQMVIKAAK